MNVPISNRNRFVIGHIKASYPCTMQSVVNWCIEQGLEDAFDMAFQSMLMDKLITVSIEDNALVINPA